MYREFSRCAALALALLITFIARSANAHDTWVETNTGLIRVGDRIDVDLKLGNHGNEHRDFKLASKIDLATLTLEVLSPSGKRFDLKPKLADLGYAPKEGYWSTGFVTSEVGHHVIVSTSDRVVNHGSPQRSVRSAKTVFLSSKSLDDPAGSGEAFKKPLDHAFELVLLSDPVLFAGPGQPMEVQLLRNGKPVPDHVVSFVPRGVELASGFDATYERRTDREGKASFMPKEGNIYLIVSHLTAENEKSAEYASTKYAATLTVRVPQICPCCDE